MQAAFGQGLHTELARDGRARPRANTAHRILNAVFQLHFLATFEEWFGIAQDLGIQRIRNFFSTIRLIDDRRFCIDLHQKRVEIEIVQMRGTTADLSQQICPSDRFIQRFQAERCQNFAHVFGDEAHQINDFIRRPGKVRTQSFILNTNTNGACVRMTLADHDAAYGDERGRADTVFFRAQHGRNHNIPTGAQATICPERHLVAQIVERQDLVPFSQAKLPRQASIFDRGLRACTGTTNSACNQNDICLCLRNPGGNRADTRLGNQLHADTCLWVDLLEIIDQLREVFDRIDIMMRRWRNQRNARRCVAKFRDEFRHLEARQLAAFTRLRTLGDLDLDFSALVQIFRRHTKSTRCDLLDCRIHIVAIWKRTEPRTVFAAFPGNGFRADTVHGNIQRTVRFRTEGAQRHARCHEALANLINRLNAGYRNRCPGRLEVQQVTQLNRVARVNSLHIFAIDGIIAAVTRSLKRMDQISIQGMRLFGCTQAVKATHGKRNHVLIECGLVSDERILFKARKPEPGNPAAHAWEVVRYERAGETQCFEIIATAIRRDYGNAHLGHDLQQPALDGFLEVQHAFIEIEIPEQPSCLAVGDDILRQISVHASRTDTNQNRKIMRVETLCRPHRDGAERP